MDILVVIFPMFLWIDWSRRCIWSSCWSSTSVLHLQWFWRDKCAHINFMDFFRRMLNLSIVLRFELVCHVMWLELMWQCHFSLAISLPVPTVWFIYKRHRKGVESWEAILFLFYSICMPLNKMISTNYIWRCFSNFSILIQIQSSFSARSLFFFFFKYKCS